MTARMFGVGINEFSIGMGPKIISRISRKSGTAYSLRLLPIGGYVSMKGEDEDVSDPDSFSSKPAWQRMIIIIAGSVMNILLGLILVIIMVLSSKNLGSTVIYKFGLKRMTVLLKSGTLLFTPQPSLHMKLCTMGLSRSMSLLFAEEKK